MEIKSNYDKCVILNDLQRQLEYYEVEDRFLMRVWDVWYNRHYLGSIHNINHSGVYTVHGGADFESDMASNFMEALAIFVEYLVEYFEFDDGEEVTLIEPIEEKPEVTIVNFLKNLVGAKK